MPRVRITVLVWFIAAALWTGLAFAGACPATDSVSTAAAIADGHAYRKHVVEERQFERGRRIDGRRFAAPTIDSEQAFASFLAAILREPAASRRLENRRFAFWDEATGTVVIVNLGADDCGTAFRPRRGRAYYDGLR
jgi:filamentous hemagglutinin